MNQQIYEEASEWLVEFRTGEPDGSTCKRFERWLSKSPEHVRAYLEHAALWENLGAQVRAVTHDVEELIERAREDSGRNVVPLSSGPAPVRSASGVAPGDRYDSEAASRRMLPFHRMRFAVVAVVLLAAVGAGVNYLMPRNVYTTAIGEQRSILLSDGSTIHLNARSRVRVRLGAEDRRVDLLEGEALFGVSKDKNRPFIVSVNGTRVRAVGTQFDINRHKRGLIVTVVEGTVAVSGPVIPASSPTGMIGAVDSGEAAAGNAKSSSRDGRRGQSRSSAISAGTDEVLLDAGQQLILPLAFSSAGSAVPQPMPRLVDVDAATAWTRRRLVFDSTPLEDVVAEFNRNSNRVLVIRGDDLDDFHISGAFSSTDVQPFIRFLHTQPGIEVIEQRDRIFIVHN